jgi:peroxiredoxin
MRPLLDERGLQIVTICSDTPAQIRRGRAKHNIDAVMLSDPDLEVTDQFNLRNEGSLSPSGWGALPIPTTILVDADGIVRWIDQSRDYQLRSNPDRVRPVIEKAIA